MTTKNDKLRFGSLVRVSTEKQEKKGESLSTQRKQNERDVERMGGVIVGNDERKHYGGQEHGTPGWEKAEVDRLLDDATKGKFDAVIVAYTDRWSRDNGKSKAGLELFRQHGIRFFVGTMEMNLFNPEHCFMLGMQAEVGEFIASQGSKKSAENRIERARKGMPTCGYCPFGREFDKEKEGIASAEEPYPGCHRGWSIDPEKQAMIQDIASRYLKGESLPKLTAEYGQNNANIYKVLRERCGDTWEQEFTYKRLNIKEKITTLVPRLLDDATIKAVRDKLEAGRTYMHGCPQHQYLLQGRVFCGVCGYNLTGQPERNGSPRLYYRHRKNSACTLKPSPWVPTDRLEMHVISDLVKTFGNPSAIERAVRAAVPDCEAELKRQARLKAELTDLEASRDRVIDLVINGSVTNAQVQPKLAKLKEREESLKDELGKLDAILADVPTEEAMRVYVERIEDAAGTAILVFDENGEMLEGGNDVQTLLSMSWEDKRELVEAVFGSKLPDGRPAGVYIVPVGGTRRRKEYTYELRGRLCFTVKHSGRWSPCGQRDGNNTDSPSLESPLPAIPFKIDGTAA